MSRFASLVSLDLEKLFFVFNARHFFRKNRQVFDLLHVHESHWLAGLGVEIGKAFRNPSACQGSPEPCPPVAGGEFSVPTEV